MLANNTSVLLIFSENKTHKGWKAWAESQEGINTASNRPPVLVILFVWRWPGREEPNVRAPQNSS